MRQTIQGVNTLRGRVKPRGPCCHYVHIDDVVPANHPLRSVKVRADTILCDMSRCFSIAGHGDNISPSRRPADPLPQITDFTPLDGDYKVNGR